MRLDALLSDALLGGQNLPPRIAETLICGLTADSRAVMPGYLFAALSGTQQDGRQFIGQAIERGAAAVLATAKSNENISLDMPEDMDGDVPIISTGNPRRVLAQMAARFFAIQPEIIACITGTNGKTSSVNYVRQLWQAQNYKAASLGTLGVETQCAKPALFSESLSLTTPEPVALHGILRDLAAHQISHLAVEASSHGLAQYRLDGMRIMLAGFTNLSRDHFDYHADETHYLAAKQRLFTELLDADGTAIICVGDKAGQQIAEATRATGRRVLSTGTPQADLLIEPHNEKASEKISKKTSVQNFAVTYQQKHYEFSAPLVGAFQAQNLEVAFGIALAHGGDIEVLCAAASNLRAARGRMQYVGSSANGAALYVDYAHTPDALRNALAALRTHSASQILHIVFGAGGDRDAGKRAQMGAVAAQLAEHIYVSDDNPRSENPDAIRAEIMAACPQAHDIGDRRQAIAAAIKAAGAGDIILLAGKGHEQGQIIGDEILPFDDAAMAAKLLGNDGGADE